MTHAAVFAAILAFLLLIVYSGCYTYCVVTQEPRGTVYFPLWNGGVLAEMVSDAGGRAAAINNYGRYAVYEAVKKMGEFPAIATNAVLLILYCGVFTSLTLSLALPATYVERTRKDTEKLNES